MSRRDDRGFWTCHATVAAVGSTGLEVWPESGVSRAVGILGVNKRSEG